MKGMNRSTFGRAQIIHPRFVDKGNKVFWSGSEMRGDGCAMGYYPEMKDWSFYRGCNQDFCGS